MKTKLLIFTIFIISIIIYSCNESDPQVCLIIDKTDCPGSDITNAVLHLDETVIDLWYSDISGVSQSFRDETHYIPTESKRLNVNHIIVAAVGENHANENFVEGYEINYGFWSKDSYRQYSWSEMFYWKYGRWPTEAELNSLTCDQVKAWFIERHTQTSIFGDDPPRDVKCIQKPYKKYCVTLTAYKYSYTGFVSFPDGTKCEIEPFELKKDSDEFENKNPYTKSIHIKKPCAACD